MEKTTLNFKEKMVLVLVIFLIKMIKPWQYDHQFDHFWADLKSLARGGDFIINEKK